MQQCLARQSRLKSYLLVAKPGSRKRSSLGSAVTLQLITMSTKKVRWAFNFTKWTPSYSDMLLATSCVQIEEKERLAKFVFKNDFKASLIGRLMLRKYVAEASGVNYHEFKFTRDENGRPVLENKDLGFINFNVSHQGDFTVLAGDIGGGLLGVDVMKVEFPRGKNLGEYFRLMRKIFTGGEWETIYGQRGEREQLAAFCRFWCLKESYLKAMGRAVRGNLQEASFIVKSPLKKNSVVDDTEVFFKGNRLPEWTITEMLLDDDHCVAVASNSLQNEHILFRELSFEELMKNSVPLFEPDHHYCNQFFEKCDRT